MIPWLFYYSSDSPSKGSNLSHQGPALLTSSNPNPEDSISKYWDSGSQDSAHLGRTRIRSPQQDWLSFAFSRVSSPALGLPPGAPFPHTVASPAFAPENPQPRFPHPQTCTLLRSPRRLSSFLGTCSDWTYPQGSPKTALAPKHIF